MRSKIMLACAVAATLAACAQKQDPSAPPPQPAADILSAPPAFHVAAFKSMPTQCTEEDGRDWATVGMQVEMMVTSLNCGSYFGNPDAYPEYRKLTGTNAELFAEATRAVSGQLGEGRKGLSRFDSEQTVLANVVALDAGGFRQSAFCEPRRAWFERMMRATREDIANHSKVVAPSMCNQQRVRIAQAEEAAKAQALVAAAATTEKKGKPSKPSRQMAQASKKQTAKSPVGSPAPAKVEVSKTSKAPAKKVAAAKPDQKKKQQAS